MPHRLRRRLAPCLGLLAVVTCTLPAFAADEWQETKNKDGIVVWKRRYQESSFLAFRAKCSIPVNIREVVAVLWDEENRDAWMSKAGEQRMLDRFKHGRALVYNAFDSGFPFIKDRDVVAEVFVNLHPKTQTIRMSFHSVDDKRIPKDNGRVRMRHLEGQWILIAHGMHRTEIIYEVLADPGGWLPAWIVNDIAEDAPYDTLKAMRDKVSDPVFERARIEVRSVFDFSGFGKDPRYPHLDVDSGGSGPTILDREEPQVQ